MKKTLSPWLLNWTAYRTLSRKEVSRFMRIWVQTLIPPAITTSLYFLIFGKLIGERIGPIHDVSYIQFIAPGLILMSILTNAYSNVSSSFFSTKFQNNIEEQLVSPMANTTIILGYVTGGVLRGLIIGVIVGVVAYFFGRFSVAHAGLALLIAILTALLFSLIGLLNGVFARSFDDVTIIPTFILTPLTYLGGVFYSVSMLPPIWQTLSKFNPIFYVIDGFRHAILGKSDVPFLTTVIVLCLFIAIFFAINLYLMRNSTRLRK